MRLETEKKVTAATLRHDLQTVGVSMRALAREAHMPHSNLCELLQGKSYLGPKRGARLQDALRKLALEQAAKKAALDAANTDTSDTSDTSDSPTAAADAIRIRRL